MPADELDAAVNAYADRLTSGATYAIKATKRSLNLALRAQAQQIIDAHAGIEGLTLLSEDHREAILAFKDKRPASFKGR